MSEKYSLDIVIPVYNEGESIISVLQALEAGVSTPHRYFLCYDRDDDTTLPVVNRWHNEDIVVSFVKNKGTGPHAAVLTGFSATDAPAVLVFPADDTFNAGIIDTMYRDFAHGFDIVAASRFMPGGTMEGCPKLKRILVRTAAFTLHRWAGLPTHDPTSGFRMFSRRLLDEVRVESSKGFTYSLELLVKCHRLGWKVSEVPAQWRERTHGRSRFKVLLWLPAYLRWYFYAFATTWLGLGPNTVPVK